MGHERVGALPHSKRWRDVVAQLGASSGSQQEVAELATATLGNVRVQFRKLHTDDGVVAAFQFLLALAKSASSGSLPADSFAPSIDLDERPTTLKLVSELRSWVDDQNGSREYADLAAKASADAISIWSTQQKVQPTLFDSDIDSKDIWRRADSGAGFCEVSRLFFAKFTERYLNYFLEREASAAMASVVERDQLASRLRDHIDDVSRFAFETSRITQSFAAGWFNSHARDRVPSKDESEGFLFIAFGKMREELMREVPKP